MGWFYADYIDFTFDKKKKYILEISASSTPSPLIFFKRIVEGGKNLNYKQMYET